MSYSPALPAGGFFFRHIYMNAIDISLIAKIKKSYKSADHDLEAKEETSKRNSFSRAIGFDLNFAFLSLGEECVI